jgi:hypothetical protein
VAKNFAELFKPKSIACVAVYESFESRAVESGVLNMPKRKERVVGGHAVVAAGPQQQGKQVPNPQLMGLGLGQKGLLHDAFCVSWRSESFG